MTTHCKRVEHPHVMPGWGCCKCATYNGLQRRECKACGHEPCFVAHAVDENKARMFFANVFDTGLMALDLAKTTVYHGTASAVAVKLRQFGFDVERLATALEGSGDSFSEALKALETKT